MDEWDLLEPANIGELLPKTFQTDVESKKWQERKGALETLAQLLGDNPRLKPDAPQNAQLITTLKMIVMEDSNIMVVAQAVKCLTGIGRGLRTKFGTYAPALAQVIFDKFKEKRPALKEPLVEFTDILFSSVTNLELLLPAVLESMAKQNPNIKIQMDLLIYRIFKSQKNEQIPKAFLKDLVIVLVKHSSDSLPEVRDASCLALGALANCIGFDVLIPLIGTELFNDKTKMAKISEAKDRAAAEAAEESANQQIHHNASTTMINGHQQHSAIDNDTTTHCQPTGTVIDPWELLEPVDISQKIPNAFESQMNSKTWQERKEMLDTIRTLLGENPRLADSPHYQEVIERITKTLATDSNINIAAAAAQCLTGFAKGLHDRFARYANGIAPIIFEKFKEKKALLRDPLVECIDALYASADLNTLSSSILEAFEKTNPNQKSELDQFLYRVFRSLPARDIPKGFLKELVTQLNKHASNSDPLVRDSSFAAFGAVMKCVGEKVLSTFLSPEVANDAKKMEKIHSYKDKAISEAPPASKVQTNGHPNTAPSHNISAYTTTSAQTKPTMTNNTRAMSASSRKSTASLAYRRPAPATTNTNKFSSSDTTSTQSQRAIPNRSTSTVSKARPKTQASVRPTTSTSFLSSGVTQTPQTISLNRSSSALSTTPPPRPRISFEFAVVDSPSGSRIPRLVRKC